MSQKRPLSPSAPSQLTKRIKQDPPTFLTIARELRNEIYHHLFNRDITLHCVVHTLAGWRTSCLELSATPLTSMLLLNHQITAEYREELAHLTHLTLTIKMRFAAYPEDRFFDWPHKPMLTELAQQLHSIRHCTIALNCATDWMNGQPATSTDRGRGNAGDVGFTINRVLRVLPNLETLVIDNDISDHASDLQSAFPMLVGPWVSSFATPAASMGRVRPSPPELMYIALIRFLYFKPFVWCGGGEVVNLKKVTKVARDGSQEPVVTRVEELLDGGMRVKVNEKTNLGEVEDEGKVLPWLEDDGLDLLSGCRSCGWMWDCEACVERRARLVGAAQE